MIITKTWMFNLKVYFYKNKIFIAENRIQGEKEQLQ